MFQTCVWINFCIVVYIFSHSYPHKGGYWQSVRRKVCINERYMLSIGTKINDEVASDIAGLGGGRVMIGISISQFMRGRMYS